MSLVASASVTVVETLRPGVPRSCSLVTVTWSAPSPRVAAHRRDASSGSRLPAPWSRWPRPTRPADHRVHARGGPETSRHDRADPRHVRPSCGPDPGVRSTSHEARRHPSPPDRGVHGDGPAGRTAGVLSPRAVLFTARVRDRRCREARGDDAHGRRVDGLLSNETQTGVAGVSRMPADGPLLVALHRPGAHGRRRAVDPSRHRPGDARRRARPKRPRASTAA